MNWHYLIIFVPAYLGTMFLYVFFDSFIIIALAALGVFVSWWVRKYFIKAKDQEQAKVETKYWVVWPAAGLLLAMLSILIYGV